MSFWFSYYSGVEVSKVNDRPHWDGIEVDLHVETYTLPFYYYYILIYVHV